MTGDVTWSLGEETYRLATREDLPAITDMLADPEVGRWLWFTPLPPAGVRDHFEPLLDAQATAVASGGTPDSSVFVVEDADGFAGEGAVVPVDGSAGGYEIGFMLRRRAWGRGLGTRLARFLVAWAVFRKAAYRIEADCLEGNLGSQRILEGVGLRREGRRPGYRLKDGVRRTEILFGSEVRDMDPALVTRWAKAAGLSGPRAR